MHQSCVDREVSSHAGGQSCGGREVSSPLGQVGSPGCVGREGGCHASGSRDVGSHGGSFKMSSHGDRQFIACLQKLPQHRNEKELDIIYSFLHGMEALSTLREPALRVLCCTVRYEFHESNDILYCQGELSTCWYILLTGSVFIEGSMFLPRSSFGKRTPGCTRRPCECLILEPSEMIVIDYPDVVKAVPRQTCNTANFDRILPQDHPEVPHIRRMNSDGVIEQLPSDFQTGYVRGEPYFRNELYSKRCSRASDTSSAYSGSDVMQSSIDDPDNEMDLSGLVESMVDSDEEEGYAEQNDSLPVRDAVRECLEKYPADRTEDDIEILLEFMQHFHAFANMTLAIRRALCAIMEFAEVEKRGTTVIQQSEELDSWSVILNGQVEISRPDGSSEVLQEGDSFGITPTMEKLYSEGTMTTVVDDCQFVCIAQDSYYRILHQGEENTKRHEVEGKVVMVTEHRVFDGGNRRGNIAIRGTAERLMQHLVEDHSVVDPSFVEDFLLTYRVILNTPMELSDRLLIWFDDSVLRTKVTRVVLLWVNNHFNDFETDSMMCEFLERFEQLLESQKMLGQCRLLNIACAAKARSRVVTLTRATREEILHFSLLGGQERNCGIFISKVEKGSKAYEAGLKRGDQILEVNGNNFLNISHNRARDILRGTTHLSILVKSNLLDFKEMLQVPDKKRHQDFLILSKKRMSVPELEHGTAKILHEKEKKEKKGIMSIGNRPKLKKALMKMGNLIPRNSSSSSMQSENNINHSDENLYTQQHSRKSSTSSNSSSTAGLCNHLSASNPDLSSLGVGMDDSKYDFPEHVVKVYRADQSFKYLLIHKETTAREVVMLALREFGVTDPSSNYSLCEVTVENEGLIKQKRLSDQLTNLPDRQSLNGRYYLKNNMSTETLVPDELMGELRKEAQINLLQLNTTEVASQLTLEDFKVFKEIEATEYIDHLFKLESKYGCSNLIKFSELVNREMFWVATEVCRETNLIRRSKLLKHFIKIARHCKDCKNFNSMFSIISGLGHASVSRLRATWDKLPTKYSRMFEDLQEFMDPTRNMAKYRNLINSEHVQPPMLPFFPIVNKDLTFIHLANDTYVDNLVNFEKLRMLAKEIRHLGNMASAKYDVSTMYLGTPSMYESSWVSGMATMKRTKNRRVSAIPNAKKMFEEAQMVRRVRAYLSTLSIISDEDKLKEMSNQCEIPARRRDPSPSVSTLTSTDDRKQVHTGPKFGAASPEAVRKLMALSDKVRPHNSKYPLPSVVSPTLGRRPPTSPRHLRNLPVHLSSESSSVVSLSNIALRKPMRTGSMGSTDSTSPTSSVGSTQPQFDNDSGHHSASSSNFDSHSTGSVGSTNSPTCGRKHLQMPQSVLVNPFPPPPPLPQPQVRPPLPPYHVVVQNSPAYSQYIHQTYTNVRRPPLPDYHSAAHMAHLARQKQLWQIGRAHSHEGVVGYYREQYVNDEVEEEQVSAV
ncbi:hypothetical protein ScPMuIL_004138 [Solemya velum]